MRGKMLISVASILLVLALGSVTTQGDAEDTYDERISDLETRVAILETQVVTPTQEAQSGQQNNVTTSSSQSSSSSSSNGGSSVYSASYSANGDRSIPFTIKRAGVYHLTAHVTSPFSARVETEDGEPIPSFSIESDEAGTFTISSNLEAGDYVLQVTATSGWNVIITSLDT
jgi:hypothetical protein